MTMTEMANDSLHESLNWQCPYCGQWRARVDVCPGCGAGGPVIDV